MQTLTPPPAPARGRPGSTLGLEQLRTAVTCVVAGGLIALAVPPLGWWPAGIAGVALWALLLADQPWPRRARRTWLVAACWLAPMMVWMWDLTAPGYVVATVSFAGYFAIAAIAVPPGPGRWVALPGAIVLAEFARWSFPFDGVPLATLAMGQASSPLAQVARIGGAVAVAAAVVVAGVAVAAAVRRQWVPAAVAAATVAAALGLAAVAPQGTVIDTIDVAAVQGGGPQRTRAGTTDATEVFRRHMQATTTIGDQAGRPVDLVVWPENVVAVDGAFVDSPVQQEISALAAEVGAPIVVGVTERVSRTEFLNASVVLLPDGTVGERYDKVLRVPFGEYVPLRSIVERLAPNSGLPRRDARAGTTPAVVASPVGPLGVAISWEVFFTPRARDGITNGGEVLLNPTNGSSYWLTQVQTQQVASSQLRAIENGRWVVQAAPTGFSAIVAPDGTVIERTDVSEQKVLVHTVERRQGLTWATATGPGPLLALAIAAVAAGWVWQRRRTPTSTGGAAVTPPATPSPARH